VSGGTVQHHVDQVEVIAMAGKPDAVANPKPGTRGYLKWWWTKGPGLAKWAKSPHPYTALKTELAKYIDPQYLDETVAQWFHDVFGYWSGDRKGKNPVGPG
jgi:hypothetical protein